MFSAHLRFGRQKWPMQSFQKVQGYRVDFGLVGLAARLIGLKQIAEYRTEQSTDYKVRSQ